ncbi:MAG: GatB/YqeY domain-containing protein [Alphaproteobacteria bacterium]
MRDIINNAMKTAMKEKQSEKLLVIRAINAKIKDADINARSKGNNDGVNDSEVLGLLQNMVKQRKESIKMYTEGNRPELAEKEQAEIEIINEFLPEMMSDEETEKAVSEAIGETGASSMADMGKVMGILKSKYSGSLDMGKASGIIKSKLS